MTISKKQMREVLQQDIEVSDTVNKRIQETYEMIQADSASRRNTHSWRRFKTVAVAAAVLFAVVVPGAAYASSHPEFFEGMFGNRTKTSTDTITKVMDTGKGSTVTVTLPSSEYVSVDPERAEALIGDRVISTPITEQVGDHTLSFLNIVYDSNCILTYFTLERPGGVTALTGDQETNMEKGARFTADADFNFYLSAGETLANAKMFVDTEKSTSEKLYCYSYGLWYEPPTEDAVLTLNIQKYPATLGELENMTDVKESEAFYADTETKTIALEAKGAVSSKVIDLGSSGYLEYSPLSLSIDMAKGLGLTEEEAQDPYHLKYLEIRYKDGTNYIVHDSEKEIDNSGYAMGGLDTHYKTAFNRLVDIDEVKEIIVNDTTFPVE